MNFNHIWIFLETVRLGGITKASQELYISQPAISRSIACLERALGSKLISFGHHQFSLTESGKIFYQYALKMKELKEQEEITRAHYSTKRNNTISIMLKTIPKDFTELISSFQMRNPMSVIELHHFPTTKVMPDFNSDLTFYSVIDSGNSNHINSLYSSDIVVAIPKGHPLEKGVSSFEDLMQENIISWSAYMGEFLQSNNVHPKVNFQSNDIMTVLGFVKSGLGIALLPAELLKKYDTDQVKLVSLPTNDNKVLVCLRKEEKRFHFEMSEKFYEHATSFYK